MTDEQHVFDAIPEFDLAEELRLTREKLAEAEADRSHLREALETLVIDARRLTDRNLGGTYEDDVRRSINRADAVLHGRDTKGHL